jgi:hypothetical protein
MSRYKRSVTALVAAFLVYGVLTATHLGEFWPFSIYPMFSQGGNPWSRAVVRDVTQSPDDMAWQIYAREDLPGAPFAVLPNGIDPIDLANFVSKTDRWDDARVAGLRRMFYDQIDERRLLVMRVNGRIDGGDSVRVEFVPYALIGPDTTALNPSLPR